MQLFVTVYRWADFTHWKTYTKEVGFQNNYHGSIGRLSQLLAFSLPLSHSWDRLPLCCSCSVCWVSGLHVWQSGATLKADGRSAGSSLKGSQPTLLESSFQPHSLILRQQCKSHQTSITTTAFSFLCSHWMLVKLVNESGLLSASHRLYPILLFYFVCFF